jgi:hypothetical protein
MNAEEWKSFAIDTVNGLERHLCISAPRKAHSELRQMRSAVDQARTSNLRKRWERKLNGLVESAPWFRGAAKRYIKPLVTEALADAVRTLKRLDSVLRRSNGTRPN